MLAEALSTLSGDGLSAINDVAGLLEDYLDKLSRLEPDELSREEALAYWVNAYNAGALQLAGRAYRAGMQTVLRVPGAFTRPLVEIAGEALSLDDIEHGKIRRFRDPRIHAALVCGSVSCPTLRSEPFTGSFLSDTLDEQMHRLLGAGGAIKDGERLGLSRIFRWYGADFVRPHRMPTLLPAPRRRVAGALSGWMTPELARWVKTERPPVMYLPYDWTLACSVG